MLGIGASHPDKDWPDTAWREFLAGLNTTGTIFLIGGPTNTARAQNFTASIRAVRLVNACDLRLIGAALVRLADLFVGPSSGPLNLAAAGATQAFGLFGSTRF